MLSVPTINSERNARTMAFTLVEIMIVMAIVGLLAAIAIPGFMRARENAQNSRYGSDIRVATTAFIQYSIDAGHYPADASPAIIPNGMGEYLKNVHWTNLDVFGGKWDWDYEQFGTKAGVSTYQPTASLSQLKKYDAMIDDGNLATGGFRARDSGYISVIEEAGP